MRCAGGARSAREPMPVDEDCAMPSGRSSISQHVEDFWVHDIDGVTRRVGGDLIEDIRNLDFVLVPRHVSDVRCADNAIHCKQWVAGVSQRFVFVNIYGSHTWPAPAQSIHVIEPSRGGLAEVFGRELQRLGQLGDAPLHDGVEEPVLVAEARVDHPLVRARPLRDTIDPSTGQSRARKLCCCRG